jgi:hypothetical protein
VTPTKLSRTRMGLETVPVLDFQEQVPWIPGAMKAIREAIARDVISRYGPDSRDQWGWHHDMLGVPTHRVNFRYFIRWHVWELPEPGWYMWARLWVPEHTAPWLEIPVKDASPEAAANAVKCYWDTLGIGLWRDLIALTMEVSGG